jgi:hypothetical protein
MSNNRISDPARQVSAPIKRRFGAGYPCGDEVAKNSGSPVTAGDYRKLSASEGTGERHHLAHKGLRRGGRRDPQRCASIGLPYSGLAPNWVLIA